MKLKYWFVYIFSLSSISFLPTSIHAGESSQSIEGNNDCAAQLNHSNGNIINCNNINNNINKIYHIYPETPPRINQTQLAPESSKTNYSSNSDGLEVGQISLRQDSNSSGLEVGQASLEQDSNSGGLEVGQASLGQ